MIVLIDNYDSFSYNLYQMIGEINPDICVIRNNEKTIQEIEAMKPSHLILSPGPGRPAQAGICEEAARYFAGKIPILGVCLGHQAICEAFGGTISYAKQLMHGKQSETELSQECPLFQNLPDRVKVGRYHSLAADRETLPREFTITAQTQDGEIMAVQWKKEPVFGLQFHPESILTEHGKTMLYHFLQCK